MSMTKTKVGVATALTAAALLVSSPENAAARGGLRFGISIGLPAIAAQIGPVTIAAGSYSPCYYAPVVCTPPPQVYYAAPRPVVVVSGASYPMVYVNGVACIVTFDIYGGRHLYRLRRGR